MVLSPECGNGLMALSRWQETIFVEAAKRACNQCQLFTLRAQRTCWWLTDAMQVGAEETGLVMRVDSVGRHLLKRQKTCEVWSSEGLFTASNTGPRRHVRIM